MEIHVDYCPNEKIEMEDLYERHTRATFDFTYIPKNERGNNFIFNNPENKINAMLELLSEMHTSYCEKGKMMNILQLPSNLMKSDLLSISDKLKNKPELAFHGDNER